MLIKLRQTEIEEALSQYIANQGINLTGKQVKIDFTASRGSDGLTADVDITSAGDTPTRAVTVAADPVPEAAPQVDPVQEEQAPEAPAEEAEVKEVAPASSLFS